MARRCAALLATGALLAVALGGCGGISPHPDPARLTRLIEAANKRCRSHRPVRQDQLTVIETAAEYLPAGRTIKDAHAERRALEAHAGQLTTTTPRFIDRFNHLQSEIYYSLKALGLAPCLARAPYLMRQVHYAR